jgi:hypothetical protein
VGRLLGPAALLVLGCAPKAADDAGAGTDSTSAEDGGDSSSGSSSDPEEETDGYEPPASCGNGTIDPGEYCHDLGGSAYVNLGPGQHSWAFGDLNADGYVDLAYTYHDSGWDGEPEEFWSAIRLGENSDLADESDEIRFWSPVPWRFSAGDLDADGADDLLLIDGDPQEEPLSVLWGWHNPDEGPTIEPLARTSPTASLPEWPRARIADFGGDGIPDVLLWELGRFVLLTGAGNREIGSEHELAIEAELWGVRLGDLNGDGREDFASTHWEGQTVEVYLTDEAGFPSSAATFTLETYFESDPVIVVVPDVDGDGIEDVIASRDMGRFELDLITVSPHDDAVLTPLEDTVGYAIGGGDFDANGITDLVVVDHGILGDRFVLLGAGDLSFGPPIPADDRPALYVHIGDYNLDTVDDMLFVEEGILLNFWVSNP